MAAPLDESRARAYQRSAMMLGFCTQLHPLPSDARSKLLSGDHANMLALAPAVPRFALLPVPFTLDPVGEANLPLASASSKSGWSVFDRLV
jgi:hypothetical protein